MVTLLRKRELVALVSGLCTVCSGVFALLLGIIGRLSLYIFFTIIPKISEVAEPVIALILKYAKFKWN